MVRSPSLVSFPRRSVRPQDQARAIAVVDLGFGDAGKGVIVDALVRRLAAHTVVRFHGGPQGGRHVSTQDGVVHAFSQIGAGAFVPGVRTILARHVVVDPAALIDEAARLREIGAPDVLGRLSVSRSASIVTPLHRAAGRLRELARGAERHGSCGFGVGEAKRVALHDPQSTIVAADLECATTLRRKVATQREAVRTLLAEELAIAAACPDAAAEIQMLDDSACIEPWLEKAMSLPSDVLVEDSVIEAAVAGPGTVVFEGAHGVLLDEWHGFHPYTTWSTCTYAHALELAPRQVAEGTFHRLGVLRSYATRHGPGPFPTEAAELADHLSDQSSATNPWQGALRLGWLDTVLSTYAIEVAGNVDGLALTHLDALRRVPRYRISVAYRGAWDVTSNLFRCDPGTGHARAIRASMNHDLDRQARLGQALLRASPVFVEPLAKRGDTERSQWAPRCIDFVANALGTAVHVASYGRTAADVHVLDERLASWTSYP